LKKKESEAKEEGTLREGKEEKNRRRRRKC
jgi:hypothetical protein